MDSPSGLGHGGSSLSRDAQTSLSLDTSSSSPGGYRGIPRPAERHSPSRVSSVFPEASSRWDLPGTPSQEGVQEASGTDAQATSAGSSLVVVWRSSVSTLNSSRVAELLTLSLRERPATLQRKLIVCSGTYDRLMKPKTAC